MNYRKYREAILKFLDENKGATVSDFAFIAKDLK